VTGLNFGPPVTAWPPNWVVWSAADTALVTATVTKIRFVAGPLPRGAIREQCITKFLPPYLLCPENIALCLFTSNDFLITVHFTLILCFVLCILRCFLVIWMLCISDGVSRPIFCESPSRTLRVSSHPLSRSL